MPNTDVGLKAIKNGFLVGYWKQPPVPKGRDARDIGMGERIEEFFSDGAKAANRVAELAGS